MLKKGRVTIKDIAEKLQLSPSTISRALHDHPDINRKTKKKIIDLAEKLNYHPDSIAQSLKKNRTKTIGVIVPEIKHDFFSSILDGIEDVAHKAGYIIIVCKSNESYDREVKNTSALVSHRIAGLLVSISQTTRDSSHFKMAIQSGIPIVFFDRVCDDIQASKVTVDDCEGAYKAVEYLIQSGYKKIAHLSGPEYIIICQERLKGYKKALSKNNIPYDESLVIHSGLNEEDGKIAFQNLLERDNLPDAIFAVNDPVAIGAYMQIKKNNFKIPDDFALVGFTGNPVTYLIDPPLTTVVQPAYKMGKTAAKLLLEEIKSLESSTSIKEKILHTKLIIRQST